MVEFNNTYTKYLWMTTSISSEALCIRKTYGKHMFDKRKREKIMITQKNTKPFKNYNFFPNYIFFSTGDKQGDKISYLYLNKRPRKSPKANIQTDGHTDSSQFHIVHTYDSHHTKGEL